MTENTTTEKVRGQKARKIGVVTSDKMDKSVVVRVDRIIKHPMYKRYVKRSSKFMAHDEANECSPGDRVRIIEHRPISKRKRWKVQATVVKAAGV